MSATSKTGRKTRTVFSTGHRTGFVVVIWSVDAGPGLLRQDQRQAVKYSVVMTKKGSPGTEFRTAGQAREALGRWKNMAEKNFDACSSILPVGPRESDRVRVR